MQRKFYRELWNVRFQKMLRLELQGVAEYEALLEESRKKYIDHPLEPIFQKLIADEKKHVALVQELMVILERQPE